MSISCQRIIVERQSKYLKRFCDFQKDWNEQIRSVAQNTFFLAENQKRMIERKNGAWTLKIVFAVFCKKIGSLIRTWKVFYL